MLDGIIYCNLPRIEPLAILERLNVNQELISGLVSDISHEEKWLILFNYMRFNPYSV